MRIRRAVLFTCLARFPLLWARPLMADKIPTTDPIGPDPASICNGIPANIVSNCGFETGDFSAWTLSGNLANSGVEETALVNSGVYSAYFGAVGSDTYLTQNLVTTVGGTYNLSFFLYNGAGCVSSGTPNCEFDVSWNGTELLDNLYPTSPSPFTKDTFTGLLATTTSTPLEFSFRQDPAFFHFDDVVVIPSSAVIPEPSALILVGTGLLVLGFALIRRWWQLS